MSDSFLLAAGMRAVDASSPDRPLPTDSAMAALELHGAVCEVGAGAGVWSALLRARGLIDCACYDEAPPPHTYTAVVGCKASSAASLHPQSTLLMVRPSEDADALQAFADGGGSVVAHAGELAVGSCFARKLSDEFERQVTVVLAASSRDELTIWQKRSSQSTNAVLDVRLELVDLEAPDWAAPRQPHAPSQMTLKAFKDSLPEGF